MHRLRNYSEKQSRNLGLSDGINKYPRTRRDCFVFDATQKYSVLLETNYRSNRVLARIDWAGVILATSEEC